MALITTSEQIENWLGVYSRKLTWDFEPYRHHVYRQVNLSLYFLKDNQLYRPEIEFCAVHHDLGLWLDEGDDIVMSSLQKALQQNEDHALGFDRTLIKDILFYHTKLFAFNGENAPIVNAFRKAHWVELSKGTLKRGLDPAFLQSLHTTWPLRDVPEFKTKRFQKLSQKDPMNAVLKALKLVRF